nr:IS1 family transposase [Azospirillum sp. B510]
MFDRLRRWSPRLICTDHFAPYENVLAAGRHYQGKDQTVALERNNGQQRHWVGACRRKSIIVSKSKAMVDRRITLFAHLHVNGDAPPEMRTLPGVLSGRTGIA